MKVLIVEDDRATRHLLEQILKARGDDVTACADAESAWEVYQRDEHSLVLIDWMLPGIDGLELCRRMRSAPAGAARGEGQGILAALETAGGNRSAAARLFGISRATLYRRLAELRASGDEK